MSKAARQSIIILIALVIGAFAFAGLTFLDKMQLQKTNQSLEQQIEEFRTREKTTLTDNKQLQDKLKTAEAERTELQAKFAGVDTDVQSLNDKMKLLNTEGDDLKKQLETARKEREELTVKFQEKTTKLQEETTKLQEAIMKQKAAETQLPAATTPNGQIVESAPQQPPAALQPASDVSLQENDQHWAGILKEKAALEVELENVKQDLMHNQVELADLKKQNGDLQLDLSNFKNQKETIDRDIKHGQDLADNLSLELARAKNDSKYSDEKIEKLSKENTTLRAQIKNLTSTKIALEKSIVRLQDDKKDMERKLIRTENVVQGRIDEIWKIKNDLNKSFKPKSKNPKANEIELPPIVVSAHEDEYGQPAAAATGDEPEGTKENSSAVVEGNVVSINEDNNFVIVDLGEKEGVKIGDPLSVYRNSEYVAGLEVIQVRKDIAAADIKNKTAQIQVGDVVR